MQRYFYTTKDAAARADRDWQIDNLGEIKTAPNVIPAYVDGVGKGWTFYNAATEEDAFHICCNCGWAVESVEDQHGFCDDCMDDDGWGDMARELSSPYLTGRI